MTATNRDSHKESQYIAQQFVVELVGMVRDPRGLVLGALSTAIGAFHATSKAGTTASVMEADAQKRIAFADCLRAYVDSNVAEEAAEGAISDELRKLINTKLTSALVRLVNNTSTYAGVSKREMAIHAVTFATVCAHVPSFTKVKGMLEHAPKRKFQAALDAPWTH